MRPRPRTTGWIVRNYDLDFLKKFSLVIGFLALVTVGLMFFANHLQHTIPTEVSPTAVKRTQERIAPEGAVYAGATGAAAQAAANASASPAIVTTSPCSALNRRISGRSVATTGMPFFDHMLQQLGTHGGFDLSVSCDGDLAVDGHHTVEDCGLAVGQALKEALGDKEGVRRFASIVVPLDEAAVEVALDLSGRTFVVHDVPVPAEMIGTFDTGLVEDFVRAFAQAAELTVHVRLRSGRSPHHVVEAEFKALAKALRDACSLTGPTGVPSTKGTL